MTHLGVAPIKVLELDGIQGQAVTLSNLGHLCRG